MIKNAIISILIVCLLQPIWIPGTSFLHKAMSNVAFFYCSMWLIWKVEEYIKEKTRHGRTTGRAESANRHSRNLI